MKIQMDIVILGNRLLENTEICITTVENNIILLVSKNLYTILERLQASPDRIKVLLNKCTIIHESSLEYRELQENIETTVLDKNNSKPSLTELAKTLTEASTYHLDPALSTIFNSIKDK